jgi:hypothetical protein
MSRFVVLTRTGLASGATEPPDGFGARLTKYLPTDIVSIYTIAVGGLVSAKPGPAVARWLAIGLMVFLSIVTFVYFKRKAPAGDVRKAHLVASPIAFVAWAYPLAAPLLGAWFIGWIAIIGQVVAAALAWLLGPHD